MKKHFKFWAVVFAFAVCFFACPFGRQSMAGTRPKKPTASVTEQQFKGKKYQVSVTPQENGKKALVTILDSGRKEIVRMSIVAEKGLDANVVAACKAKDFIGQAKTLTGCLSTAATGLCLYTGGGAGVGAVFCASTIEYAVDGGAIDCAKGMSAFIAKMIGEDDALEFTDNPPVTPGEMIDKSVDKACEAWEMLHGRK